MKAKGNCTYKITKYLLIIIVVLAIGGSILFNITNELKCYGEWDDNNNSTDIMRTGKGFCKWVVGLEFIFKREPIISWEAKYEGDWKNNKMDGEGVFHSMSGCKYEGGWKEDQQDGKGKFTFNDQSSISGNWFRGNLTCTNGEMHLSTHKIQEISGARYKGHLIDGLMHGSGQLDIADFQLSCLFAEGLLACENGILIYNHPTKEKQYNIQFWNNQFRLFNYQSDITILSKYSGVTYKLGGNEDALFIPYYEGKIVDLNFPVDQKAIQEELSLLSAAKDYVQNFEINFLSKHNQMKNAIYDFGNSAKEEALKKELYLQKEKESEEKVTNQSETSSNDQNTFFNSENPFKDAFDELKSRHEHGEL